MGPVKRGGTEGVRSPGLDFPTPLLNSGSARCNRRSKKMWITPRNFFLRLGKKHYFS